MVLFVNEETNNSSRGCMNFNDRNLKPVKHVPRGVYIHVMFLREGRGGHAPPAFNSLFFLLCNI